MPYTIYIYPNNTAKFATQIIRDISTKKEAQRVKNRFGGVPSAPTRHARIKKN